LQAILVAAKASTNIVIREKIVLGVGLVTLLQGVHPWNDCISRILDYYKY